MERRVSCSLQNGVEKDTPDISVNMLFRDGTRWDKFARDRLNEIEREAKDGDLAIEVIIVFNSCDVDFIFQQVIENFISRYSFPITVLFHTENNIPKGRNLAAHYSSGRMLWIADDDVRVSQGTLRFLYDALLHYPVGALSVRCHNRDGQLVKPAPDMPTFCSPTHSELTFAAGVHGMAFLTYRALFCAYKLSETRILRGEWVEWFTRLWRAGIPVGYLLGDTRYYLIDEYFVGPDGKARSATRSDTRLVHALISMLHLLYEYRIVPKTMSSDLLREKYFATNLDLNGSAPVDVDLIWHRLIHTMRRSLRARNVETRAQQAAKDILRHVGPLPQHIELSIRLAFKHMFKNAPAIRQFKAKSIEGVKIFDVAPFEIFAPDEVHRTMLEQCIERAPGTLERYRVES